MLDPPQNKCQFMTALKYRLATTCSTFPHGYECYRHNLSIETISIKMSKGVLNCVFSSVQNHQATDNHYLNFTNFKMGHLELTALVKPASKYNLAGQLIEIQFPKTHDKRAFSIEKCLMEVSCWKLNSPKHTRKEYLAIELITFF